MNSSGKCFDREKIFGCVHRMLGPAEEAEVRRHLEECADCRRVAQEFEKLDAVLGEWPAQEVSPWFEARLKQKLAAPRPAPAFRFFGLPSTRIFAAALLVLMVVAGAYMIDELPKPGTKAKEEAPAAKVESPVAAEKPAPAKITEKAKSKTASKPLPPEEELKMYQNLNVLEDFDLLEGFDVLSELPKREAKRAH